MKKILPFVLIVLLFLTSCYSAPAEYAPSTTTPFSESNTNVTIHDKTNQTNRNATTIEYPEFYIAKDKDQIINSLMKEQVTFWISKEFEQDSKIYLTGRITLQDESIVSVLFEGDATNDCSVHPTKIAFSVCICLDTLSVIDPVSIVLPDDSFVTALRLQLSSQKTNPRYTPEQMSQIFNYINGHSTAELISLISNSPLSLTEHGVIVCLNVPHSIGDYIKIEVRR